ncbi:MAG: helix-turn-helix domain-containing protein [archaeon]
MTKTKTKEKAKVVSYKTKDISSVAYVLKAKNREKILENLLTSEKTARELEKQTNMHRTHIHRTLRELESKDLIEIKNPEDKTYRFYKTSRKGRSILSDVKKRKEGY